MSGTEAELPATVVQGDRVEALPLPPPARPKPPAPKPSPPFAPAREGGAAWVEEDAAPAEPAVELGILAPDLRRPRMGIAVNGQRLDRLLVDAGVVNNSFLAADTFDATLAFDEDAGLGPSFWADTDALEVEVFAGFGTSIVPNKSLVLGRVDDVELDLSARSVRIGGRDYTAEFLEAKTTEKWPNKTSSEIAEELAGRHGLTPVVTATTVPVGKYYEAEHARLTDDTTEWNLLAYLAEEEGMEVWVEGRELHFEPPAAAGSKARWTLRYRPPQDGRPPQAVAERFRLRQSKTISREITVKVVTWNSKQKKAITVERQTVLGRRGGTRTPYVFRLPGLTEEQAIREAERRLADITRHHRTVVIDLPGHPDVTPRAVLAIEGTGTGFDTIFQIDSIERRGGFDSGFSMTITGRTVPEGDSGSAAL